MPTLSRTIRLFVSSTFSDTKTERDVLQREVLPKLRQLCLANGMRFQARRAGRTARVDLGECRGVAAFIGMKQDCSLPVVSARHAL